MAIGLALFLTTLILRAATANRHVRGRLLASALAFAAYALLGAGLRYPGLSPTFLQQVRVSQPLLLAFGAINALVAGIINPWRADRLPDRFPNIVQDAIVLVLFTIAATMVMQDRMFATTAAGAVVLGFALQDTLGNLFAGLAIQIEKPFRVGHWVRIGEVDGLVREVTWRATKIRTKAGNFVVVPNSQVSDGTITNYSEPTPETRIEVEVGASYDAPPNHVKATIVAALRRDRGIPTEREPEVLLVDFGGSAMVYRIRVWTTDFAADERIRDRIRSAVYYAFRRESIEIPYPIQVEMHREPVDDSAGAATAVENTLARVSIFSSLSADERAALVEGARPRLYAAGELIVRQGDPGESMFVVASGGAVVMLEPDDQVVAQHGVGGFFGEMSLLTGSPRAATVRATTDSQLIELTVDAFRRFVLTNPAALEGVGLAVAQRAAELAAVRAAGAAVKPPEPPQNFLGRVRRFLNLASDH
jgi:small-conductance mechanosensitive channel